MAKTEYEIVMNFRKARLQADRLDSLGRRLQNLAEDRYEGTLHSLNGSWKGENAEAFLKKSDRLKGKMLTSAKDLFRIASTIRTIAQNTYNAEMNALRIAQARNS